ncbi:MAG: hypothetical protein VCA36_08275 [Opitutales bacterium]
MGIQSGRLDKSRPRWSCRGPEALFRLDSFFRNEKLSNALRRNLERGNAGEVHTLFNHPNTIRPDA